jgi:transposase
LVGNSPDLNPIENDWNFLKNKRKSQDISSVLKLKEAILKMWTQDICTEYLSNLSSSMPRRLEAVIKKHKDMTKY